MKNGNSQGKSHGANRRKNNQPKNQAAGNQQNRPYNYLTDGRQKVTNERETKNKKPLHERPKWMPPQLLTSPIPAPLCPICKKPIKELASALIDKVSGEAAHFDCVRDSIVQNEVLDAGDVITYIGGGRFGVVYFEHAQPKIFKIKKVIEWEMPENRPLWREDIADHFSLT